MSLEAWDELHVTALRQYILKYVIKVQMPNKLQINQKLCDPTDSIILSPFVIFVFKGFILRLTLSWEN